MANRPNGIVRDVLGAIVVAAFVGVLGVLFYKAIPPANEQLIVYMLGQLSGFVAIVIGFHYVQKAGERELEKQRTENTAKALDAIKEAQAAPAPSAHRAAEEAADQVAEAAEAEAETIRRGDSTDEWPVEEKQP